MSSLSASSKFTNPLAAMGGPGPVVASRSGGQGGEASQDDQSAEFMQSPEMGMISSLIQALTQGAQQAGAQPGATPQSAAPQGKLQSAAAEIAQDEAGRGALNGTQMQNLASGKSVDGLGTDSAQEQQAAAYIMGGAKGASGESKRWEKIETADVGGADDLSSLANFKNIAAQGDQKAGGAQDDAQTQDLLKLIGGLQAQEPMLHGLSQGLGSMGAQLSNTMTQSLQQLMSQQEKTLKSIMGSDD